MRNISYILFFTISVVMQCLGLGTSLFTLSTVLVSYHKSLRLSQPSKAKMKFCGMLGQFLWCLFTISARVTALAVFASQFKYWVFLVVGLHWLAMLVWVVRQQTTYCYMGEAEDDDEGNTKEHHSQPLEVGFRLLTAFVQIFCFFNLLEGHTRLRYTIYYILVYVENGAIILVWYIMRGTDLDHAVTTAVLVVVLAGFLVGVLFMVLYYKWCHPNNSSIFHERMKIRWCVPCSELSLTEDRAEQATAADNPDGDVNKSLTQSLPPATTGLSPANVSLSPVPTYPAEASPVSQPLSEKKSTPKEKNTKSPDQRSEPKREPGQRLSLLSAASSQRSKSGRFVQPKWDVPERAAAGSQKNTTFDSDNSSMVRRATQPRGHSSLARRQNPDASIISDTPSHSKLIVMSTVV